MSTLPDSSMKDTAGRIIDLLGDAMDFQRKEGGIWEDSASGVKVHVQPRGSYYRRSFRGVEDRIDFKCYAAAGTDIKIGDRTAIGGTYYVVDGLEDRTTHLEFGLKETEEQEE
jgi:hypothetical protein